MNSHLNRLRNLSKLEKLGVASAFLVSFGYWPAYEFQLNNGLVQLSLGIVSFSIIAVLLYTQKFSVLTTKLPGLLLLSVAYLSAHLVFNWHGLRSLMLFGLWGLILLIASARNIKKDYLNGLIKGLIFTSIFLVLVSVIQLVADAWGMPSGLSAAYTGNLFGFARAHAFFEEPQFLASYLLLGFFANASLKPKHWQFLQVILVFGLSLTMSRGVAIGALAGLGFYHATTRDVKDKLLFVKLMVVGAVLGLGFIGFIGSARSSFSTSPFYFQKVYLNNMLAREVDISKVEIKASEVSQPQQAPSESSAGSRFSSSKYALEISSNNSRSFFFGRGLASFNAYNLENYGTADNSKGYTVNNFFVETLFEFGVLGLAAILTWFSVVVAKLARSKDQLYKGLAAMLVASMAQQLFFSSIVNNLHFWLIFAVLSAYIMSNSAPAPKSKKV